MKKTIRFFIGLVLLLTVTGSCERETLLPEETVTNQAVQSTPIDVMRTEFSLDNFNDPANTIKDNIEVQWENHITKTIAGTLWYEFSVTQKQKADMVSEFQEDNQYKLLARLDEHNRPHYFIAKLAPQKGVRPQTFSYLDPEGFSGTVSLHNMQGEVAFLEYYKKGQVQNSVQDISVKGEPVTPVSNKCMQKGTAMAKCDSALECAFALADGESTGDGCGSGGNAGGSYVAVRTDHYTDWYNIRNDGTADYSHTQFNGSTYDYVYVSDLGTSGGHQDAYSYYMTSDHGAYGTTNEEGHYADEPPLLELPERIIIALEDKEACINKLLMKNGGNYVNTLLQHFEGESEFDIKIKSKNTVFSTDRNKYVNGQTRYTTGQNIIYIDISTDKLSTMPALAAARTLIHEYIHADIFRKLNTKYPNNGELDFKKTYEKYETEKHHNAMADLYVNSIRDALKDFHKNVLVGDYNYLTDNGTNPLPDSFYEALAWQGLKEHNVQAYTDLSDSKKAELTNSLNTYYHSTTKNCPN